MSKAIVIGEKYGNLTVLQQSSTRGFRKEKVWQLQCKCKRVIHAASSVLRKGAVQCAQCDSVPVHA